MFVSTTLKTVLNQYAKRHLCSHRCLPNQTVSKKTGVLKLKVHDRPEPDILCTKTFDSEILKAFGYVKKKEFLGEI